ncbi:FG-GAP repeat protein [candidate division WOR-3 bacterium]|nr:FG-GAP repeat protein [candidate division WOR-3 bacterium]
MNIILSLLLFPAAIGHDIQVLWEKGYTHAQGVTTFGFGIDAGDLDADGAPDIAVSWGYDDTVLNWIGGVYVFTNNPLDTFPDITVWTHKDVGSSPHIVVMDINGDGKDDLIAGNYGAVCKLAVYFGPLVDSQPADAWMDDDDLPSYLGSSMSNAGDVNGDGYNDLIASGYSGWSTSIYGGAYIYFGGPDFGPGERQPDVMLLGGLNHGSDGYKEYFGFEVGGGGDFNADGYDDVIISAPTYGNDEIIKAGRVYVYFGGDPMDTVEDVAFTGEGPGHWLGKCPIDLLQNLVGAYAAFGTEYFASNRGKAYVLFGGKEYDDIVDVEILGRNEFSHLTLNGGTKSAGDADYDGRDDLIIGAPMDFYYIGDTVDWLKGAAFFYRGGRVIDEVFDGWLEGSQDERVGQSLAPAGDFNGDGRSEFLVSNYTANMKKVWLCTFTGPGIEEGKEKDAGLELILSATVTRNEVRFYYDKPVNKEATLSIYDVTGALVRRYEGLKESGAVWDLRDDLGRRVSRGAYTVRLTTEDAAATQRVVVVR